MEPPETIDGAKVVAWAWAGDHPFGLLRDPEGHVHAEVFGFAIARYAESGAIYRFSCDADWETVQDEDCTSIEEAKQAIPAQYDRARIAWRER